MTTQVLAVDRLDAHIVEHRWAFDAARAQEIDRHWEARRRVNPALYDGAVLLGRRVELLNDADGARVLRMELFETRFSRFLAWRDFGWPDEAVYNCFAMPAVRSSDGAYLLGEMGSAHSAAGQLYFPGGTPDPSDILAGGRVDLEGNLIRELAEETGLAAHEGRAAPGWSVVFDRRRVACIKRLDWEAPAAALLARVRSFLAAEQAPELADAHMIGEPAALADSRLPAFMVAYLAEALAGAD